MVDNTCHLTKGQSAARRRRMKIEERLKEYAPTENVVISDFTTLKKPCHWKCLRCGAEFDATPDTILRRHSKTIC